MNYIIILIKFNKFLFNFSTIFTYSNIFLSSLPSKNFNMDYFGESIDLIYFSILFQILKFPNINFLLPLKPLGFSI